MEQRFSSTATISALLRRVVLILAVVVVHLLLVQSQEHQVGAEDNIIASAQKTSRSVFENGGVTSSRGESSSSQHLWQLKLLRQEQQEEVLLKEEAKTHGWRKESYPRPDLDGANLCRSETKRMCDPGSVLSDGDIASLEESLALERTFPHPCPGDDENEKEAVIDVQYAVALTNKMNLEEFGKSDDDDRYERGAKAFARYVHDDWGVGMTTRSCGGTGVLIFLSVEDRVVYISRGEALSSVLTKRRLDETIRNMRPLLREARYQRAIRGAVDELQRWIDSGQPGLGERFETLLVNYGWVLFLLGFFGFTRWSARKEEERRREYAQVASHLTELDRARAEALQGRFRSTSCPICLEPFQPQQQQEQQRQNEEEEEQPDNNENGQQAPQDTGASTGSSTTSVDSVRTEQRIGSDGLPVKLLRCGHVFDETCWGEWVSSGQGQVNKCPICQQDVSAAGDCARSTDAPRNQNGHERNNDQIRHQQQQLRQDDALNEPLLERDDDDRLHRDNEENNRILRQYNRERTFRLQRLGARYPRYIRPHQIQRWTRSTYDGSLVKDPNFVRSHPDHHHSSGGSTSARGGGGGGSGGAGRSSGFGGGTSGGGCGGRW